MDIINKRGLQYYRIKLLISYIVISLIPIILIGIDLYGKSVKNISNNIILSSQSALLQYEKTIDLMLFQMENLANNILVNPEISRNLTDFRKKGDRDLEERIQNQFMVYNSISTDFSVQVFTDENRVFGRSIKHLGLKDLKNIKSAYLHDKSPWILQNYPIKFGPSQNNNIYYIKPYLSIETGESLGQVIVQVEKSYFDRIFAQTPFRHGFIFLLNKDGLLISGEQNPVSILPPLVFMQKFDIPHLDRILQEERNILRIGKDVVLFDTIEKSQWKLIGYVSHESSLELMKYVKRNLKFLTLIVLLLSVFFAAILTSALFHPLQKLQNGIERFGKGDTEYQILIDRKDDFRDIISVFNQMVLRINRLIRENVRSEQMKRKSELMALNSQINPHFLYNTLESIKWMAEETENRELSDVILHLARFFKTGLSRGHDLITIRDEIVHVKSYLFIQKFRYSDDFNYQIHIDPSLEDYLIPKITLQPLVENAIYHGLVKKNGTVMVRNEVTDRTILLFVCDNGRGIGEDRLKEVNEQLLNKDSVNPTVYGMKNVDQRIKLWFGMSYGLIIKSSEGNGTVVTVKIPAVKDRRKVGIL